MNQIKDFDGCNLRPQSMSHEQKDIQIFAIRKADVLTASGYLDPRVVNHLCLNTESVATWDDGVHAGMVPGLIRPAGVW